MCNFEQNGCVIVQQCLRHKRKLKEQEETDVLARIAVEPTSSTRKIASESGISNTSILRILKTHR